MNKFKIGSKDLIEKITVIRIEDDCIYYIDSKGKEKSNIEFINKS